MNGDGKTDIVTANIFDNTVSLLLGDGAGGFQTPIKYQTALEPNSVALTDTNHDGLMDIVVTDGGRNSLTILTQTHGSLV